MSEFRRRLMMVGGGAVDGHQIAQVRMPLGSCLDTGYYPNNTTKVEFGAIPLNKGSYTCLCGGRTSQNEKQFSVGYDDNLNQMWVYCGTNCGSTISRKTINLIPLQYYEIEFSDYELVVNNNTYSYGAGQTFTSDNTLAINGMTTSSLYYEVTSETIFYYFKIYDNGVLVRDYVPWKRSNGIVGMLDRVNNVFRSSATNVVFKDNTITLPSGYTRLNYVTFTGAQRFNTGFIPNQSTPYYIKCKFVGNSSWKNVLSSKVSSTSRVFELANGTNSTPNSRFYFRYNNGATNINITHGDIDFSFVKCLNFLYVYKEGVYNQNVSRTRATYTCPTELTVGCENTNGAYASWFVGDIYEIDFMGTLPHYIPCVSPNNEVGFYDVNNGVFKTSETSTPLVAGMVYGT